MKTDYSATSPSQPSISNAPKQSSETEHPVEQFQWTQQWYPVAVVEFLDPSRPHALDLLGTAVVLWRDGSDRWRCFEDACPHRLAPLSEGRVEADGNLLCAYHAWRFDGTGQSVRIPQSKDAEIEARNCANPKSCVTAYPTQEKQGLLWVWPEPGAQAETNSQQHPPRLIPEIDDRSGQVVKMTWNIRDLPYGWDFFMENVADHAHVTVSHHGLVGDRNQASYYDMPRIRELSTQEGFSFGVVSDSPSSIQASHDFQPPCLMRIETKLETGGGLLLVLYATPTKPGWCRHIGCQVLFKNDAGKTPPGLAFFALPMPAWMTHILASLFLHQDMVLLHHQEKAIARRRAQAQTTQSQERWLEQVYTPNPQDKMVITFRQWLEQRAGGSVAGMPEISLNSASTDSEALFDVWNTHTKHCQTCQTALKNINRAIAFLWGSAATLLLLAVIVDARTFALSSAANATLWSAPPMQSWIALAIAGGLGVSGYLLKKFSRLFYVYQFSHANND